MTYFHKQFKDRIKTTPPHEYEISKGIKPDYWLPPTTVWQIAFDSMTRSPLYRIGAADGKGGISVRFPRFVHERKDKQTCDANTASDLISMYESSINSLT